MMLRTMMIAAMLLALTAQPAFANMAQPWIEGAVGSEPSGIEDVRVVHEALDFELHRGGTGRDAHDVVTATYELDNQGPARTSPLQFVALGITDGSAVSVTVNGDAVPISLKMDHPIAPEWKPPETTPVPGGGESYLAADTRVDVAPSILFQATLKPGENRISVRYQADPSAQAHGRFWLWQTAYVLAPAKSWESFGTLEVTVRIPDGFRVATSLPLEREGIVLRGTFDGIPADSLTISTQQLSPVGPLWLWYALLIVGSLLLFGLPLSVLLGRWFTRTTAAGAAFFASVPCTIGVVFGGETILGSAAPGWSYGLYFTTAAVVCVTTILLGIALFLRWGRK